MLSGVFQSSTLSITVSSAPASVRNGALTPSLSNAYISRFALAGDMALRLRVISSMAKAIASTGASGLSATSAARNRGTITTSCRVAPEHRASPEKAVDGLPPELLENCDCRLFD